MRALCVGRHRFLSEHLALYFGELGLECRAVVGFEEALAAAHAWAPDLVVCDYDLLATAPLGRWERDALLSRRPVIAVSLTRRPEDVNLLDVNAIAGFLYLPALDAETVVRLLDAVQRQLRPPVEPGLADRDLPGDQTAGGTGAAGASGERRERPTDDPGSGSTGWASLYAAPAPTSAPGR